MDDPPPLDACCEDVGGADQAGRLGLNVCRAVRRDAGRTGTVRPKGIGADTRMGAQARDEHGLTDRSPVWAPGTEAIEGADACWCFRGSATKQS